MSPYEVAPGALSLKGVTLMKKKKRRQKVSKEKLMLGGVVLRSSQNQQQVKVKVPKTKHELAFEAAVAQRRAEMLFKKAQKSRKQQIMEFNAKLDSLSEHFDIPKVSWTK